MRIAICPTAHLELAEKVIDISFNRLIDAIRVVPQVKQFELRIAKRPGLPSEIASALWQKGVHIQAFSAQLQEGQEIFHLAVDKAAVAKQTFIENGWKPPRKQPWLRPKRSHLTRLPHRLGEAP